MSATITTSGLGVRFSMDRQGRPLTPVLARLRRTRSVTWGLRDVSLTIEPGEGIALIGSTGSGKTTLLRVLAGILPADAGSVCVRGRIASLLSTEAGLLPTLSARDNALLLAVLTGLSRAEARAAEPRIREESGLGAAFDQHASSLSGGMRARLSIAAANQADPQILLLDEVHEALDHRLRASLRSYAHGLLDSGGIVIAAGHDHPLLAELCPRAVQLDKGEVRGDGPFDDVRRGYLQRVEAGRNGRAATA